MKSEKIILLATVAATFAVATTAAYLVGRNQSNSTISELNSEIEELSAGVNEAAVVKRVSQQMEDIAYQQKAISDKQRDRAEQQTAIATSMRNRAEQESKSAREAEHKAIEAAKETEKQRANAIAQQRIAEEQRDEATHAKSITDTLSFRTLARTLGNSSISQFENKHTDMAKLLAYTSWYYTSKYKGNAYQSELFKALNNCTNTYATASMPSHGAVNAICKYDNTKNVAVSNYGSIILLDTSNKATVLVQNKNYDFRDVYSDGSRIYALDFKGILYIHNNAAKAKTIMLPAAQYFRLLSAGNNMLLAASRTSVSWINTSTGSVASTIKLGKHLNAIVKKDNVYSLFFEGGTYAELNGTGTIVSKPAPVKSTVTAACYSNGVWLLGGKNGELNVIKNGKNVITANVHTSKITNITMVGNIMVTSAYDKSVLIWDLQQMYTDKWLSPVSYKQTAWPLCLCNASHTDVLFGTSNGQVHRLNVSTQNMASALYSKLKRNFTEQEWNLYVGKNIKYVKLK